ncbi:MAG: hypothetical protein ABI682_02505 [Acidobacteriota bacterium]
MAVRVAVGVLVAVRGKSITVGIDSVPVTVGISGVPVRVGVADADASRSAVLDGLAVTPRN